MRDFERFNRLGTSTNNELGQHLVYEHQVLHMGPPQPLPQQWEKLLLHGQFPCSVPWLPSRLSLLLWLPSRLFPLPLLPSL